MAAGGAGLAALLVALALRFRLSRARIQEFLAEWLGLELSIGTIHQTLYEAASYRHYPRRLRCGAHLVRKARGLAQSGQSEARAFGKLVLETLEALMAVVYAAREGPPPVALPTQHAPLLAALRAACAPRQGSTHPKTHALAVELLNDGEAIFPVLAHPELPLTNNEAGRALRHWVILRKLSLGAPTPAGWRVVTLLASVIDTSRQRGQAPWRYLERAIADRRAGLPLAPLPQ